ncbi:hypothetical protein SO802_001282 [Lithocarpus litseifolius]|uniref:Reverse transcriptase domain-containing protein n=1 Tax=Lithocarpus litseifolius TaxID=425828 RepID=A0AAW2DXD0_9ROSI
MAPLKAPGPDGMPPLFYQNFWSLVGDDVSKTILSMLNSATIPHPLNHTFITLIPKIKNPLATTDYRPISLCNVLYKIFSKVLANRLKKILPSIITKHQSAFTKNHLISDNILVAFETLHSMNNHKSRKSGFMAVKFDMSKAYDRVEWCFLEEVMRRMGFNEQWITLMMICVKTVSYSVLVNGEPQGMFQPSRGIRQGDPLSPFLFLLCTEGLNSLIVKAEREGFIHGYSLSKGGPKLTHLLFADDSILFCRSNRSECQKLLDILALYEILSGQKINRGKTSIFFSKSTTEDMRIEIKEVMGVPEILHYDKYLGLPSLVGRNKNASFDYIKERVWRKLQDWEEKLLSQAGREVLIKAVVQAIPTFTMSCFKLPMGLCDEIEKLIRRFWWGQRGDRRKIHWVRWEEMCKPKSEGGMGFKELALFNDALLAKQTWRLLHNHDSLLYKVFKSRFFPNCSILEAKEGHGGSYAWRSILKGREVIRRGARWRVGGGENIKIWRDKWLPSLHNSTIQGPLMADLQNAKVSSLINPITRQWKFSVLHNSFRAEEVELIQKIPLSRIRVNDTLFWPYVQSGEYSVRSGYFFLKTEATSDNPLRQNNTELMKPLWKKIWKMPVPCKVRNFLWRACRNAIPTMKNLQRRCVVQDSICPLCSQHEETVLHAIWSCPELALVWEENNLWNFRNHLTFCDFPQLLHHILDSDCSGELFAMQAWTVWFRRNKVRTAPPGFPLNLIAQRAYDALLEFRTAQQRSRNTRPSARTVARWSPPTDGWYKANFDAATFQEEGRAGIGIIWRNSNGLAMASVSENIQLTSSVVEMEAMAAIRAIELSAELGFDRVVFEGDCQAVMKALTDTSPPLATFGLLIQEAQVLAVRFSGVRFQYTSRDSNNVAHNLARYARHITGYYVWMEDVPVYCLSFYQADMP